MILVLKCFSCPNIWKRAYICLVFKKGSRYEIEIYRPVCILCKFAKNSESISFRKIYIAKLSISFLHTNMGFLALDLG